MAGCQEVQLREQYRDVPATKKKITSRVGANFGTCQSLQAKNTNESIINKTLLQQIFSCHWSLLSGSSNTQHSNSRGRPAGRFPDKAPQHGLSTADRTRPAPDSPDYGRTRPAVSHGHGGTAAVRRRRDGRAEFRSSHGRKKRSSAKR